MSGGSFNYAYGAVQNFADELELKIDNNEKLNEFEYAPNFPSEVIQKLKEIEFLARRVSALMREVEWLYSGDTGPDSFLARVREIEGEVQ